MKVINDVVEWMISSGALVALFIFAWKYVKPWLDAKSEHASTEQTKALWELLEKVADTAVNSLVSNPVSGKEKAKVATQHVEEFMSKQGMQISKGLAASAVQAAYEKSNLTPTINPNAETTTGVIESHSDIDPVMEAIKLAPNRANVKGD